MRKSINEYMMDYEDYLQEMIECGLIEDPKNLEDQSEPEDVESIKVPF